MVDDGRMPKPVDVDGSKRWDRFELDDAVDNLKDRDGGESVKLKLPYVIERR